jgi:alpha-L-fucosidase
MPHAFALTSRYAPNMKPLLACALLATAAIAQTYEQRIAGIMSKVDTTVSKGRFHATWDSLVKHGVPEWYVDAKFGIFIHWGVYSVPAFDSEWYPRNMYLKNNKVFERHIETYGPQAQFGYKDFIPKFTAEKFDADRWAEIFRKAGAKYVVPVAEHHDGFPMYDCSLTEWSAAKMGPKRDIIGLLASAVRKQGMHFGASSHRAEHWWFFNGGMQFDSDVRDPRYASFYGPAKPDKTQPDDAYLKDWLARTVELVDNYQPELIWFDWWIEQPVFAPYLQKFAAYYYDRGQQWKKPVAINYKKQSFPEEAAVLDIERGQLDEIRPLFWQTDTSIDKRSWGYIANPDYKSAGEIVGDLIDIVSKNGALLLNIGPRPDGTIPEEQEKILLQIGEWLTTNGEAIYKTRPWRVFGEGPTKVVAGSFKDTARKPFTSEDIRFTSTGDALYAIALAWPANGKITIRSLAGTEPRIKNVQLLGSTAKLKWTRDAQGLTIDMPAEKPGEYAYAFKIK